MSDIKRINAVAEVLSDEGNVSASAGEVAEMVLEALDRLRRREFKYMVVAQDRSVATPDGLRAYCPTWVRGPFFTAAEAGAAARAERKDRPGVKVMTAQLLQPGEDLDPEFVKEVLQ